MDLTGSREGVSSSAGNGGYCGRESSKLGGLMSLVRLSRICSVLSSGREVMLAQEEVMPSLEEVMLAQEKVMQAQ